jgi:hypothetical protein
MTTKWRTVLLVLACMGVGMISGCQNWPMEAGITIPSPWYLGHPPQYFPPSPPYPLPKELNGLEEAQRRFNEEQAR